MSLIPQLYWVNLVTFKFFAIKSIAKQLPRVKHFLMSLPSRMYVYLFTVASYESNLQRAQKRLQLLHAVAIVALNL
jgi:hypothetical protein